MIKITDLEKIYRTEEVETVALNKLSIEVKEGEFVSIMGPSGCGKSTLLNILGLLDDPDAGSFIFNGIEVNFFTILSVMNVFLQHVNANLSSFTFFSWIYMKKVNKRR